MNEQEHMSKILQSGGFAFPGKLSFGDKGQLESGGMTIRDWFAGQALTGLMAMVAAGKHDLPEPKGHRGCAAEAYRLADAMLAERAKAEGRS